MCGVPQLQDQVSTKVLRLHYFYGIRLSNGIVRLLYDQTGSGKSKQAGGPKPEIHMSHLADKTISTARHLLSGKGKSIKNNVALRWQYSKSKLDVYTELFIVMSCVVAILSSPHNLQFALIQVIKTLFIYLFI